MPEESHIDIFSLVTQPRYYLFRLTFQPANKRWLTKSFLMPRFINPDIPDLSNLLLHVKMEKAFLIAAVGCVVSKPNCEGHARPQYDFLDTRDWTDVHEDEVPPQLLLQTMDNHLATRHESGHAVWSMSHVNLELPLDMLNHSNAVCNSSNS